MSGTGEMAQWIRCLPCKHGDLYLTPRIHVRKQKPGMVICNCNPSAGEAVTCGSLGFTSQPNQLVRNANCDTLRKLLAVLGCCESLAAPLAGAMWLRYGAAEEEQSMAQVSSRHFVGSVARQPPA